MELAVRDQQLTQRVGLVTLLALIALAVLVVWIDGCRARSGFEVTMYLADAGGLKPGAQVHGVADVIGQVTEIALVPGHRAPPGHLLHGTGGVAVRLRITEDPERLARLAPHNGEFFIASKGPLGERYVAIAPPPGDVQWDRPLRPGDQIRGVDPPLIDRMLIRSYRNLMGIRAFVRAIEPEVEELAAAIGELGETLARLEREPGELAAVGLSFRTLAAETRAMVATWSASELRVQDLRQVARSARATVERASAVLTDVRARLDVLRAGLDRTIAQIPRDLGERVRSMQAQVEGSLARLDRALATTRELQGMLERGEGSIGAILHDPELPEEIKSLTRDSKRQPWRMLGRPPRKDRAGAAQ